MGDFSRFGQSLIQAAGTAVDIAGGIHRLQAQAQLDKAEMDIMRESMRFKEELAKNTDYNTWIVDKGNGIEGAFGQYKQRLESMIGDSVTNNLARGQADRILQQYLINDEQAVRQMQRVKVTEQTVATTRDNLTERLSFAQTPEELIAEGKAQYAEKYAAMVQGGLMGPKEFDDFFMQTTAPLVSAEIQKGIQRAIDLGGTQGQGLEAAQAYVDSLQDIKFGPSANFFMTRQTKDGFKQVAAKLFEDTRKAREAGYEEALNTNLVNQDARSIGAVIKSKEFQYWADPQTREHWASIYFNLSAPKGSDSTAQKALDDSFKRDYMSALGRGADQNELRKILMVGNGRGVDPDWGLSELRRLNSPVIELPELDQLTGQIKAMAKPVAKGKKAEISESVAGQWIQELNDYAQQKRLVLKPGELGERLNALKKADAVEKMNGSVQNIVRKQGIGDTRDEFEDMQYFIQSGKLDGMVSYYVSRDGSENILLAPWKEALTALHEGQKQLYLQDFDTPPANTKVLMAPDGPMQAGQAVFTAADGQEYAYFVPKGKADERLYRKGKDGWSEAEDILPKRDREAMAAKKLKTEEAAARQAEKVRAHEAQIAPAAATAKERAKQQENAWSGFFGRNP